LVAFLGHTHATGTTFKVTQVLLQCNSKINIVWYTFLTEATVLTAYTSSNRRWSVFKSIVLLPSKSPLWMYRNYCSVATHKLRGRFNKRPKWLL